MKNRPLLPPFPKGWYALGLARELAAGDVRPVQAFGRDLVLYRTESGAVNLVDAYCPHLGAHLGHGGRIVGESIRCPFHGFAFGLDGACTYIPYDSHIPPKARMITYPIREKNGLILTYFDPSGGRPAWEIPDLDGSGWGSLMTTRWDLRGHPQEVTENSVDVGHFDAIHGYVDFEYIDTLKIEGAYLYSRYAMTRPRGMFGRPVRFNIRVHVHGLGYSQVDVHVERLDLRARLFVLPTPVDGEKINLRIAATLHQEFEPRKIHPLLGPIPRRLLVPIIARETFKGFIEDVQQDFAIWQHKRYVQPPILAAGDGPVGPYRQWAKQFYAAEDQAEI